MARRAVRRAPPDVIGVTVRPDDGGERVVVQVVGPAGPVRASDVRVAAGGRTEGFSILFKAMPVV